MDYWRKDVCGQTTTIARVRLNSYGVLNVAWGSHWVAKYAQKRAPRHNREALGP